MFAGKKSAQLREILISESAWEEMTCLFAPSLSRGTGAYTYDWTPETRYGSMKSVSLQRIQPLTEQLNLGLTAGKVWYDTPTDDYNGLQLAAHLTWKF